MSIFKCKICGGTIEFNQGDTVGVCDSCGTKQTLPRLDDDRKANLYDRANHFRRNNEFDKAATIYEQILNEDTADAEAYWSLVLCNYGIEYVEDPSTHKRIPTVNRAQFTSIFDDDNYKLAIKYADTNQRELYENEAKIINDIQKGILDISQKEEPFDVFICYKETDNNGRRTNDSVLANELYHQLIQEGFKVFFARITLEDKLGTAYEPYIFAALNSAKVMVVLGTKPEYFNAVWVKNEWSRYLSIVKKSRGRMVLIPAYKDMDPYDLPDEFSHLQAQDMSKLGFMQDLIRGIKKIVHADVVRTSVKEPVIIGGGNKYVTPLLERAFIFLEDGKWEEADAYCEKVLDIDPKNPEAYLGKLMSESKVAYRDNLKDLPETFNDNENYNKIIRFGSDKLVSEMERCINYISERNKKTQLSNDYNEAVEMMNRYGDQYYYNSIAEKFESFQNYKDSIKFAKECREKAEISRMDKIYCNAKRDISGYNYEAAISKLKMIPDYIDSNELILFCESAIENNRLYQEKVNRFNKKIIILTLLTIIIIIIINVVRSVVAPRIEQKKEYDRANYLIEIGDYSEAMKLLKDMNYKDSIEKYDMLIQQYPLYAPVGGYLYFGSYEQDNDASNGSEAIEWLVLDKEDNRLLLISKYALDCIQYNTSITNPGWEKCSLRKWLNDTFCKEAFSYDEQKNIYSPDANSDKVFLLNYGEAKQYLDFGQITVCKPTSYAISKNIYTSSEGNCYWWLRTRSSTNHTLGVSSKNYIDSLGYNVNNKDGGVRPALWLKID